MTRRALALLTITLTLAALCGTGSPVFSGPDALAGDSDIAVQARGPVHEAYAQPFDAAPQPGPMVPKGPPEPVPEMPPDQKPEGDNVQWVPGYWGWDGDRKDYVWVSGFWRAAPPDRKWVAGYWSRTDDGWQWVPGYWAPADQERPPLLDQPPDPLEAGPSVPPPDDRSFYVPGVWVRRAERYLWRPGYWRPCRLGWVWVPAHYAWTPGGFVFVDGYWDYPLETRGVLFAPVWFARPLWETRGWCYRPRYVVAIDTPFFSALFVRPSCGHYYFGDYYDRDYLTAGYEPWCRYAPRHYDPLYGYYRWSHHDDPGWMRGVGALYAGRRAGDLARPPRTLADQAVAVRRADPASVRSLTVVQPLSEFRGGRRLATIDRTQVADYQAAARRIQESARQRGQAERPGDRGRPAAVASPGRGPVIVNRPADPIPPRHHDARPAAPVIENPAPPRPLPADAALRPHDLRPQPTPPAVMNRPADPPPPRRHDARPAAPVIEHPAPVRPQPTPPAVINRPADPPPPRHHDARPAAPQVINRPPPAAAHAPVAVPDRHVSSPAPPRPAPAHASAPPPARHTPPPPPPHNNGGGGHRHDDHKKK
jgi:hypothetical protein